MNKVLGITLAVIQLLDIGLHVATNQAEPVRIAASVAIGLWLAALASGRLASLTLARLIGLGALVVYLGLNLLFLAQAGLTNPAQGGAPRVTLFVLVILTTALSGWLLARTVIRRR